MDNGAIVMTYDAFGRWVERYNPSQNRYTQAVYGPDGSEVAVMAGSTLVSYYVNLPKGAKAVYGPSGLSSYWHPDWLGTPRLMTSPTRTILADLAFGAYGEQYQGAAVDSLYTGVAQAPEATDLRKFPARNLSTIEGRWITPDPAGMAAVDITNPQSFNRYAYVLGNPLGLVDPTGMCPQGDTNCFATTVTTKACRWWEFWCSSRIPGGSGTPEDAYQWPGPTPTPVIGIGIGSSCERCGGTSGSSGAAAGASAKTGTPSPKTLSCQINSRAANIPGGQLLHSLGINHEWITTSTGKSAGMGTAQGVPQSDYPGVQTQVVDHTGQVPNSSTTFSNVDAAALNTYIQAGAPTGPWIPGVNDCNTWANGAVNSSTPHNITVVMYGVPVTIATGVVVYSDGSIHAPGGH